jgi:acetyl esterase/lipase
MGLWGLLLVAAIAHGAHGQDRMVRAALVAVGATSNKPPTSSSGAATSVWDHSLGDAVLARGLRLTNRRRASIMDAAERPPKRAGGVTHPVASPSESLTRSPPIMRKATRWPTDVRRWIALALALGALFLASWIFLPAPNYFLLRFGVGAPEVSAWLMAASLVAFGLSLADIGAPWIGRITLGCSVVAFIMSAVPLSRFASTSRRFDAAMRAALGDDALNGIADETRARMRSRPLIAADLFRGVDTGNASVVRHIPVAAPGGTALTVDVYRPRRKGPFPTVVQIYGGRWQHGEPGEFANFASWLATRGYVVFSIDYRHAPQAQWPAQSEDVRTELAWIRDHAAQYDADPTRVAIIGRSAGAHLALLAAYTPGPLPIRGVVSYYGPTDLVDSYMNPPRPDPLDIRDIEEKFIGGTPQALPDRYRDASPISYATQPLPPTLLVYGGRDHIVEPRNGARLRERLTSHGTTAIFLEIPWAEHAFDEVFNGLSSQLALYHTERFLAWALAPARGPTPRVPAP